MQQLGEAIWEINIENFAAPVNHRQIVADIITAATSWS